MSETSETQQQPQQPEQPSPVGVLVVTHGDFGKSLLEAAQMIMGPQQGASAVSVLVGRGVDEIVADLKAAQAAVDAGRGVLFLTDLFGGTPTTLSLSLLKGGRMDVVAGVNLPMLLKVLQVRSLALPEIVAQAKAAGQQGIVAPSEMLRKKSGGG